MPTQTTQRKYLLTQDEGEDNYVLQIDNSSMETLTTCPRSAYYSLIQGRVAVGGEALVYGSAHHEGLEAYYKGKTVEEVRRAVYETFDGNVFAGWRTPESALESIMDYMQRWKHETIVPLKDGNGTPMVEIPFSIPLGEIEVNEFIRHQKNLLVKDCADDTSTMFFVNKLTIFWTGKIDMFIKLDGGNWIMDHKTSSIKGESYYAGFELSHQTIGYTWAGEQILKEPVTGFLLNLIINRKPTKTGKGREFDRRQYYYPRYRIDEWPKDTMAILEDLVGYLVKGSFPPMRAWCVGKYGKCRYHDVCCVPPENRIKMLHSTLYQDNTWSPLD